MDVYKDYSNYLLKKGCREEIKALIDKEIAEWKTSEAFVWYDDKDPYDHSGDIREVEGKKIGDIASSDLEVLGSLTGARIPTFESRRGWDFQTVGQSIGSEITDVFAKYYPEYIAANKELLCKEFKLEPNCDEDDLMDSFWNEVMHCCIAYDWFPEYIEKNGEIEHFLLEDIW